MTGGDGGSGAKLEADQEIGLTGGGGGGGAGLTGEGGLAILLMGLGTVA